MKILSLLLFNFSVSIPAQTIRFKENKIDFSVAQNVNVLFVDITLRRMIMWTENLKRRKEKRN